MPEVTSRTPRRNPEPLQRRRDCTRTAAVRDSTRFVYVIRSRPHPARYYVGLTSDVGRRLETHNSGGSIHTAANRPWQLVAAIEFSNPATAIAFERYLKSGSGRAFAKRHFV
jgi:putative endonuclease